MILTNIYQNPKQTKKERKQYTMFEFTMTTQSRSTETPSAKLASLSADMASSSTKNQVCVCKDETQKSAAPRACIIITPEITCATVWQK